MNVAVRELTEPQARLVTALVDAKRAGDDRTLYVSKVFAMESELHEALARLEALEREVHALTQIALRPRPLPRVETRLVEWRPDHRRKRDGGQRVKDQRRAVGVRT